ncbi:MAG: ABC transporter permease, partial [Terriglobales bacterium]
PDRRRQGRRGGMKYTRLLLANLFRKKIRTTLTIGSFAIALLLFGILAAVRLAFNEGADVAGVDRLVVRNKTSIIQPLPLAYRDRLLRIAGVKEVTFLNWFGGTYQDERNFFPQMAIDVPTYRKVVTDVGVTDNEWKAFEADRQGAIVGESIAQRFHWKVGDHIPIKGVIFQGAWEFNLYGIAKGEGAAGSILPFFFHEDYLEERRTFGKGTVGWYVVRIENPDNAARISKEIDREFSNSPFETKSDSEKEFAASWAKQLGNIKLIIMSIGAVVFVTLLLVTGNTMATAIRERVRELAVLKAIGYSDRFVLWLVLAEGSAIAMFGGVLGLLMAAGIMPGLSRALAGLLPPLVLLKRDTAIGLVLALGAGVLSTILPATSAMRLRVVDALRRV